MSTMAVDIQALLSALPEALRANPELRHEIFRILSDQFPSREETNRILQEIRDLRARFDERFARIDERFEALTREMNERFARVDERFEALTREMNERFARVDERFEALTREMNERFARMDRKLDDIHRDVNRQVGGLQTRAGRHLEDLVAGTLRLALELEDLDPRSIEMRRKIVDRDGVVRPAGREIECDMLVSDGKRYVFEITSYAKGSDAQDVADKVTLVKSLHPEEQVVGILIAYEADEGAGAECERLGVRLVL
ncbi:MAG: hypothetical protein QME96_14915 [Myxococcota bacterium]|nr:hypothetical protein [Myxococcota bacterium]